MEFHDFEIRAWLEGGRVHALVHGSPAGDMRAPVSVPVDSEALAGARRVFRGGDLPSASALTEVGRRLTDLIFSDPALRLLDASLAQLGDKKGLRVRLCLDDALVDLPWEVLYLPASSALRAGHLALDGRVSLVRGARRPSRRSAPVSRKRRLLFAGAPLLVDGVDCWAVEEEHRQLTEALRPANDLLTQAAAISAEEGFERALADAPIDLFHYSGHADVLDGKGFIVERTRVDPPRPPGYLDFPAPSFVQSRGRDRLYVDPLSSAKLAMLLRNAGTRLAVFSACNSGDWQVVAPLLQAGIPAVVGVQGAVYTTGAIAFCQRLYTALATGLSLDEAVTWARLHLLEPGVLPIEYSYQWSVFMVYMATTEAVLLPRDDADALQERQEALRGARQQTIINVTQHIGTIEAGAKVIGAEIGKGEVAAAGEEEE